MFIRYVLTLFLAMLALTPFAAQAERPVVTDSRIKTFVYNEYEVFSLTLHYGYQTSVEFSSGEEIQTVSLGDQYAWKVDVAGRRVFLKPLEPEARTNMTIITNKHSYQLDLISKRQEEEGLDEDLVYVVRFFYPDKDLDEPPAVVNTRKFIPNLPAPKNTTQNFNFNYTYTGNGAHFPQKAFDDGKSTYFAFQNNNAMVPHIFRVTGPDGREERATFTRKGEYIVVDGIAKQFKLRLGESTICVFNENYSGY